MTSQRRNVNWVDAPRSGGAAADADTAVGCSRSVLCTVGVDDFATSHSSRSAKTDGKTTDRMSLARGKIFRQLERKRSAGHNRPNQVEIQLSEQNPHTENNTQTGLRAKTSSIVWLISLSFA
jgi:hypothetical protein